MKRICIYVTYDLENIVDDYVGYMLQALRRVADYLVVVCNYAYISRGIENVRPYADKIYYRENIGFDAGAYKDALCKYLGWEVIGGYDELLLVNDSFFGPFYSLEDLFERMKGTSIDYWGMTRCPEVELADGNTYGTHIQSYFLTLRSQVLRDKGFRTFWEDMPYPASLLQAIITFEIKINNLLQDLGFTGSALTDMCPGQWKLEKNENPHILYPMELIRDAGVPILKKKCLRLVNKRFDDAIGALSFIREECAYDICLIEEHLRRVGKGGNFMGIDTFYASHSRIFIYGAGFYGRNVAEYFEYKGWTFEKFIVTDADAGQEDCVSMEEAGITGNDGIIIAVGNRKAFMEILRMVEMQCGKDQIFNRDIIL